MSVATSSLAVACACALVAASTACSRAREDRSSLTASSTSSSASTAAPLGRNARRLVGTWVRNIDELLASQKFQEWLATAPDPSAARKQVVEEASQTRLAFSADGTVTREDPPPAPKAFAHWRTQEDGGDDLTVILDDKETVRFHFVDDDRMESDDEKVWARLGGK